MTIKLDYPNMLADVVKGGVPMAEWEKASKGFAATQAKFDALRASGNPGFLGLPHPDALKAITSWRDSVRGKFEDIVVLGIGGSALGPIALRTALRAPNWNALSDK